MLFKEVFDPEGTVSIKFDFPPKNPPDFKEKNRPILFAVVGGGNTGWKLVDTFWGDEDTTLLILSIMFFLLFSGESALSIEMLSSFFPFALLSVICRSAVVLRDLDVKNLALASIGLAGYFVGPGTGTIDAANIFRFFASCKRKI